MNNWQYANVVPTKNWRGAATLPRELRLKKVNDKVYLASSPVKELNALINEADSLLDIKIATDYNFSNQIKHFQNRYQFQLTTATADDFSIHLTNNKGEELIIGYDKKNNNYYADRTNSGKVDFESGFARKSLAPRIFTDEEISLTFFVDAASVEVFADGGLTVLTSIFFPNGNYNGLHIKSPNQLKIKKITYAGLKSIVN